MLEEENKKETQESEQVPAAERIQEPEAVSYTHLDVYKRQGICS